MKLKMKICATYKKNVEHRNYFLIKNFTLSLLPRKISMRVNFLLPPPTFFLLFLRVLKDFFPIFPFTQTHDLAKVERDIFFFRTGTRPTIYNWRLEEKLIALNFLKDFLKVTSQMTFPAENFSHISTRSFAAS